MEMDKRLDGMMDCIKQAFINGCQRGLEFKKMRHGIIVEMKKMGLDASEIRDKLEDWNKRCERPPGPSELKIQLFNYVDWVFKQPDPKIGCRSMETCGYCLGKEKCQFYLRKYSSNRKATVRWPLYWTEIRKFLEERFKGHIARELIMILEVLSDYQYNKEIGETMFISFRKISSLLRDKYHYNPQPMEVKRKIWTLISEQIIEIAVHGKSGTFFQLANGYRFLPWVAPGKGNSSSTTHINPYV